MQRIKIAAIEIKEGDNTKGHWRNFIFTGDDKAKASMFEPNDAGLKPSEIIIGDEIAAEIELKGKYANIKTFKVVEHGAPAQRQDGQETNGDNKRDSIERQTCLKCAKIAFEFGINENDVTPWSIAKALKQAEAIYQWIHSGIFPKTEAGGQPEPPPEITKSITSPPETVAGSNPIVKELYEFVKKNKPACKSDKNVEAYLQGVLKIDLAKLTTEPEKVLAEVKTLTGWK